MNLKQVISELDDLSDDLTIYVMDSTPVTPDTVAFVDSEPEEGGLPSTAVGLRYFLEVSIAKDVIRVWSQWRGGAVPSLDQRVAAVLYYADHDEFVPVEL